MTAVAFLRMLKALRKVLLQDAAAMLIQLPDRKNHCFFHHPLFLSTDFHEFCKQMEDVLLDHNPEHAERATVDSILPGINSRLDRLEEAIKAQNGTIHSILGCVDEMNKRSSTFESDLRQAATILAGDSRTVGNNHRIMATEDTITQGAHGNPPHGDVDADFETARHYVMIETFQCVQDMVDCWFGKDNHRDIPIKGGICECERRWQNKWRKHWDVNTDQKKLSRLRTVVLAINGDTNRLQQLELFWRKTQSLFGLVKECESLGYRAAPNRKKP